MREILFKAKRLDNGEWVEGLYLITSRKHYIVSAIEKEYIHTNAVEIDPNTLSQYTGLKDKNGNKIFENDIVRYIWGNAWNKKHEETEVVNYNGYGFHPFIENFNCDDEYYSYNIDFNGIEIIGNIFDNKELLEKVEE